MPDGRERRFSGEKRFSSGGWGTGSGVAAVRVVQEEDTMGASRLILGPAVVAAIALTACAGVAGNDDRSLRTDADEGGGQWTGSPQGSLTTMGFGGEDEVGASRVDAYEEAFPQVQVEVNPGDFDPQQFLTAVASGNPPDLVYMDRKLIGTYAAKGVIEPLDDCISEQAVDTSQYRPAAMAAVTYEKQVYGIPEFYVVTANLLDAKDLEAAGVQPDSVVTTDWAALEQTAKKLYEADGSTIRRIGYDPKLPDAFPLWVRANGAEIVDEDGSPNLDDPKAVEALQYTVGLVNAQGGWTRFKAFRDSFDIFGEENPLTKGTILGFPMENWYVNVLRDSIPAGLELSATPFTDRRGNPVSTLGGSAWAVPKGSKNPVAACAWAKTMTATDTWMKAAEARMATVEKDKSFFTGLFTANAEADEQIRQRYLTKVDDPGFETAIQTFYGTLDAAKASPPSPAGAEIDAAWQSAVQRALEGTPPQEALARAQSEAQDAFDAASRG